MAPKKVLIATFFGICFGIALFNYMFWDPSIDSPMKRDPLCVGDSSGNFKKERDETFPECQARLREEITLDRKLDIDWKSLEKATNELMSSINKEKQAIFMKIYENSTWGGGSGKGSTLTQTINLRCWLNRIIKAYDISMIIDAPCGDFWWMPQFLNEHPDLQYVGVDIVPQVVARNKLMWNKKNWEFNLGDLSDPELWPKLLGKKKGNSGNIAIFSRQALQHNKMDDILTILKLMSSSGADYLIQSNHADWDSNIKINDGEYTPYNWLLPPFNLPAYIEQVFEFEKWSFGYNHYMGIWSIPFVKWAPGSAPA